MNSTGIFVAYCASGMPALFTRICTGPSCGRGLGDRGGDLVGVGDVELRAAGRFHRRR